MSLLADDLPDVTVAGRTLVGDRLRSCAGAVAERVQGRPVVAIEATATLETVVGAVGCLFAGVPFVPIPPDSGVRERAHLLADSGADMMVEVDLAQHSSGWSEPADCDPAMVLYTSGTTGAPKGVPVSRSAVTTCLDGLADAWAWTCDDVLVHGLPLFHVHGLVLGVLGALRVGSPLIHTGRPTPDGYAAAAEAGGTLFFGVPTVWGRIAGDPSVARALASARLLVSGSAGLPRPVFEELSSLAGQGPIERYGMTETLITVATRADAGREPGWVGTPITGVETRVLDDSCRAVVGEVGDLYVRGATVFSGYLGSGSELDPGGWFSTGDAALIDESGRHRILGRARDDLIESGGFRIGAGEIEAVLLAHPSVSEVAVVGEPDADLGQRIVAYVIGEQVEATVLIDLVATELSAHKRPREIRFVTELPRNAMGKIQKSRLSP